MSALSVPAKLPANYALYVNHRFGFRLGYPRFFRASVEPDNGGGRRFTSEDGRATIVAYGSNTHHGQTLADEYISRLNNIRGTITYKHKSENSFEIAWASTDDNQTGFIKTFFGPGSQNSIEIECTADQKEKYDSVLVDVTLSFRPGDLREAF